MFASCCCATNRVEWFVVFWYGFWNRSRLKNRSLGDTHIFIHSSLMYNAWEYDLNVNALHYKSNWTFVLQDIGEIFEIHFSSRKDSWYSAYPRSSRGIWSRTHACGYCAQTRWITINTRKKDNSGCDANWWPMRTSHVYVKLMYLCVEEKFHSAVSVCHWSALNFDIPGMNSLNPYVCIRSHEAPLQLHPTVHTCKKLISSFDDISIIYCMYRIQSAKYHSH